MIAKKHKRGDFNPETGLIYFDFHNGKERWCTKERFQRLKSSHAIRTKKWANENPEKRRRGWLLRYNGPRREHHLLMNKLYLRKRKQINRKRRLDARLKDPERFRAMFRASYRRTRKKVLGVLAMTARSAIRRAFLKLNKTKDMCSFAAIGCTVEELKIHIEKQFKPGMSWSDTKEIHIDHIIPLSSAKTKERMMELCHYTNLCPLWAEENLIKGAKIYTQQ